MELDKRTNLVVSWDQNALDLVAENPHSEKQTWIAEPLSVDMS